MIRTYVIEDHQAIIVSGLKRFFFPSRDGIEITGSASSVEEAVAKANPATFDLIILDLWLENKTPIPNIKKIREHFLDKKIIIYTYDDSAKWKRRMYLEGAHAYLTKNTSRQELKSAIYKVSNGEKYFTIRLSEIDDNERFESISSSKPLITDVEREILSQLAHGKSHKEIAKSMIISLSTLDNAIKRLRIHFGVKNNLELVSFMTEVGEI